MSIASDLIARALRTCGALAYGETADPADSDEAFSMLNDMLDQWSLEDLMIYYDQVEMFPLVAGTSSYTIGPTGDFVTVRPVEIFAAFYRDSSNLDSEMSVVSNDTYQRLTQKSTQQSVPSIVMYQPTNPNGTILVWPTPSSGFQLRLETNKLFVATTDLSSDISLPVGYNEAIIYNLAERLCIPHGRKEMLEEIRQMALNSKLNIKRKNKKKNLMFFDPALLGGRGQGTYNPYTDR